MTAYSSIKDVTPGVSDGKVAGIEFAAVNMTFADGTTALKSLDLTIEEGEFVVFVGPSGCGKSTALRILAGLEQATGGTVAIKGRDVTDLGPQQRDIAMVFQSYALYPHKSVYENLAYPLRIRGLDKGTIETAVAGVADLLGLTALLKRKPGALSGGQRQRVAMGRALVRNPEAFLMDEPLSNLDAALRVEMRGEIKRLHRRLGVTTVYVTHDQVEAMTMGDRVAVLRGGELQQFDAPQRLYEQPANMFVASFIGSPAINLAMAAIGAESSVMTLAGTEIGLPPSRRPEGHPAGPVMVGIRPEAFSYRRDLEHDVSLTITPDLIESLGAELLVHFALPAAPVPVALTSSAKSAVSPIALSGNAAEMSTRFIAKLDARCAYAVGKPATVWFSTDHLMLFEAATGRTILASAPMIKLSV
ncbi:ATP-binding cassette domain-containing protein [Devosia sp.]|uniref:ABC transporter ATP-binding protein n=1 Tax=Devosia sp. TaxID=1871048 RepID=UPI0025B8E059|nr:ATP-binding cassette domain-containing protein [Devosia sp.]